MKQLITTQTTFVELMGFFTNSSWTHYFQHEDFDNFNFYKKEQQRKVAELESVTNITKQKINLYLFFFILFC